jgi:hypothetical protein
MITRYGREISPEEWLKYVKKIKNDVFKLLPLREEGLEWDKHLNTVMVELNGFVGLTKSEKFISILSKLEALLFLEEFLIYRKTIFEVLSILDGMEE